MDSWDSKRMNNGQNCRRTWKIGPECFETEKNWLNYTKNVKDIPESKRSINRYRSKRETWQNRFPKVFTQRKETSIITGKVFEVFPEILIKSLTACRIDRFMKVNKKNI